MPVGLVGAMISVAVRGKVHMLAKRVAVNSSNEPTYGVPVKILAKLVKKKYVNFAPNMNKLVVEQVFYTNAAVDIGDKIDGREVTADFGNGKYGVK